MHSRIHQMRIIQIGVTMTQLLDHSEQQPLGDFCRRRYIPVEQPLVKLRLPFVLVAVHTCCPYLENLTDDTPVVA